MRRFLLFCIILPAVWLGSPSPATAAGKPLIAVVMADSRPRSREIHAVFAENLGAFCSSNCQIYLQTPNDDIMSLRNSIRKAVALGAEMVVVYGPAAALAAKAESPSIPTLFADVYDPVSLGLVSAKTLTGRKMTGIRGDAPTQALIKYYSEATGARRLVIFYDETSRTDNLQKAVLEESCRKRGITVIPLTIALKDHLSTLDNLPDDADGLFLAGSQHSDAELAGILAFAGQRRLLVISQQAGTAEMGAFMVLETSAEEQGQKLAEIAGQVLAGIKVENIPVSRPRQVAFVINLKVAREYGIQVPIQTLSVASRIVR